MKNNLTKIALVLSLSFFSAPVLSQELNEISELAAFCGGRITGNASVNFALESIDEETLLEVLTVSTTYLWTSFREDNLEPEDLKPYSAIHAESADEMINHYNDETWNAEVYEEVINCWTEMSIFMQGRQGIVNADAVRQNAANQVNSIKTVFGME